MKHQEILTELKAKKYQPVYFLQGEESYFIDLISDYCEDHILSPGEKDFNLTVLYGKDTSMGEILSAAKRYPMMAERQVIIVKEAQNLERSINDLEPYLDQPTQTTILVFAYKYKTLDGRKSLGKRLKNNFVLFNADKVADYKIPEWISDYCKSQGLNITPKSAILLNEFLGNDLSKIVGTLEKLKIVLDGDTSVNEAIIEKNVGISNEYNFFELQKALAVKDILKSNKIILHFGSNPKNYPLIALLAILYGYFAKVMKFHAYSENMNGNQLAAKVGIPPFILNEYKIAANNYSKNKLAKIFSYLREYDLKCKGVEAVATPEKELMMELVFKILH